MKYLLRILLSAALALAPIQAWAASGATTVPALDSNSTARNFNVYSSTGAITGNLSWMNAICDFTTVTQCAHVDSSGGLSVVGEGTAGTPAGGVFSIQGVSSGTAVPVSGTFWQATQPVSGTFWQSTQPVSIASGGVASGSFASGSIAAGAVSAGAYVSGSVLSGAFASGSLAAGSMVDLLTMRAPIGGTSSSPADVLVAGCQYNASAPTFTTGYSGGVQCTINGSVHTTVDNANANGQTTASSSSPVVLASNQSVADPCMFQAKSNLPINNNSTSSTQLIALSGSTTIYVCSLALISASANTVAFTTGTGTACVTGNAAVLGSTTANIANSISLAANGGLTLGNGEGTIAKGAASSELCIILGSATYVSGNLTYVQQ